MGFAEGADSLERFVDVVVEDAPGDGADVYSIGADFEEDGAGAGVKVGGGARSGIVMDGCEDS